MTDLTENVKGKRVFITQNFKTLKLRKTKLATHKS